MKLNILDLYNSKIYFPIIIFTVIISLSIVCVLFLKVLSIIGFIKIDFNIIMSITNPFYFLKSYSVIIKL